MGKKWEKRGNAQGMSIFCPCKRCKVWSKDGKSVAMPRGSPLFSHTRGVKCGQRMGRAWQCPGEAHSFPMQEV
ncbi:hypothetical protein AC622_00400 [Bacillus sp. FJAT-27916]|nr:hypothetical protein AC622_00400 [Bacillus sp. FJAT-27916]